MGTALVALAVVLITFAIGVATKMHRVIDIAWGLGFAAIAITTFFLSSGHGERWHRIVPTVLTVIWGVRLACAHLQPRSRASARTRATRSCCRRPSGNPNLYALRMVYLLQAAIMWFVSLPIQVVQYQHVKAVWALVAGAVIWAVGCTFEAVGDWQLTRFSRDPANKTKVLNTGLWRYTRHPNHFGDATVWWGLWVLSLGAWSGLFTILSPVLMSYFLAGKVGQAVAGKGDGGTAAGLCGTTSLALRGFVPLPPRSS